MTKKTKAELKAKLDSIIKPNGNREITPEKHNSIETDEIDSFVTAADGGFIFDQDVGYSTEIGITDDRQFASKKYVDNGDQALQDQIDNLSFVTRVGITGAEFSISNSPITSSGDIDLSLATNAVNFSKIQQISTNKLLGRSTVGSGDIEELTLGSTLSLSSGTLSVNPSFNTASFQLFDNSDNTKLLKFNVSAIGSGATRNIIMPNNDVNLGNMVSGPASATDNAIARFDTTTGKLIQDSLVTISDAGLLSAPNITVSGFTANSVIFAGSGGALSQDNANFNYTSASRILVVGSSGNSGSIDLTGSYRLLDTTLKVALSVAASTIVQLGSGFPTAYLPTNISLPGKVGTDQAGDSYTFASGPGNGAGAESLIKFATPTILTTGTTAQTSIVRMQVGSLLTNTNSGFAAMWLGPITATGSNFSLLYSSSALAMSHASLLEFRIGGAAGSPAFTVSGSTVTFGGRAAGYIPVTVKAHASQSVDLTQWQNSSSTVLAKIDLSGNATFPSVTIAGTSAGGSLLSYSTATTTASARIIQNRVTTTDATVTTLQSFAVPTGQIITVDVDVTAIRTGGSAGTSGDMGAMKGYFMAKNVGGTVTIQKYSIDAGTPDQTWPITFLVSGTNVLLQVQGTVNNNVTWNLTKGEVKTGGV